MTNSEIITRLETLEVNHQQLNNTVSELTNLMRYQMLQSERDRQQAEIDRNTFIDTVSELGERVDTLTERFNQFVEQAAADRQQAAADRQQAAIDRQFQSEINQQFQAEIRRIWEYQLGQGRNGGAPQ